MKISLIIATYNRGESLRRTLECLVGQTLPAEQWQVVVVNNRSTDSTREVAERFAFDNADLNVEVVDEMRQGLSWARNCGIERSLGDWLIFVDDDVELAVDFLERYARFFDSSPDAMAAGGRIVPIFECEPPAWISHYTVQPVGSTIDLGKSIKPFPRSKFFIGANMAIRREAFAKCGVFDTGLGRMAEKLLGGEEKDLCLRIRAAGLSVYYVPIEVRHIIPPRRLTDDYFDNVTYLIGVSERRRTQAYSAAAYGRRLMAEAVKWCGTIVFAAGFALRLQPIKSRYLLRMRVNISRGLLALDPCSRTDNY